MAATKRPEPNIPQEEDPNSPFEGLYHLLRRCIHGHDTTTEAICHYQDVFGHSSEEEHEKAAEGEYKEVFYRLYDAAYGTVQMINFDRKHGVYARNLRDQVECLEADLEDAHGLEASLRQTIQSRDKDIEDAAARILELEKAASEQTVKLGEDISKYTQKEFEARAALKKAEEEIIRLKARLFDMMEAQK